MLLGWNMLASLTYCIYALPEWLWIMLLLGNIGLDFFLTNLLHTYIVIILARQGYTFDMSIHDIESLGIPKRSLLKMLSHFSSSIWKHFASKKALHKISFTGLIILPSVVLCHLKKILFSLFSFSFSFILVI